MPAEIRIWKIIPGDQLEELHLSSLDFESRLETWLEQDISVLSSDLLVIGRQVETTFGGFIDLLCLDRDGDAVIVELKRGKTPREITAQVLDYASWVYELSHEVITDFANDYPRSRGLDLPKAFYSRFGTELPSALNEDHSMFIVGATLDPSSERIIRYLSQRHGVNINAASFSYFRQSDDSEFLARIYLLEPEEVENRARRGSESKRLPNLTREELAEKARQVGVGDLCQLLAAGLEDKLSSRTTRSSLVFYGRFDSGYKAVFSVIPNESVLGQGLRYHAYQYRLSSLLKVTLQEVEDHLPDSREPWKYYATANEDMTGFAGFFRTVEEAHRFLGLFDRTSKESLDGQAPRELEESELRASRSVLQ